MLVSWYDRSLRDRRTGQKLRAGRVDMLMSVYLPYCDKFITAEQNGEQERCLREVAAVAGLETEILSYDNFYGQLLSQRLNLCRAGGPPRILTSQGARQRAAPGGWPTPIMF